MREDVVGRANVEDTPELQAYYKDLARFEDLITREAYSHEVISHGFWPGNKDMQAAFYSYTSPEPEGLSQAMVRPAATFYSTEMKEFFLLYDDVRESESPEKALMDFCQSTYEAGANLARWDRAALER